MKRIRLKIYTFITNDKINREIKSWAERMHKFSLLIVKT